MNAGSCSASGVVSGLPSVAAPRSDEHARFMAPLGPMLLSEPTVVHVHVALGGVAEHVGAAGAGFTDRCASPLIVVVRRPLDQQPRLCPQPRGALGDRGTRIMIHNTARLRLWRLSDSRRNLSIIIITMITVSVAHAHALPDSSQRIGRKALASGTSQAQHILCDSVDTRFSIGVRRFGLSTR